MISYSKQVVLILCAILIAAFWPYFKELLGRFRELTIEDQPLAVDNVRIFTSEELSLYNGHDKPQLYLSLLGNVYDVTNGEKHYGKDGSYHYFTGRDASVAFITGDFESDADNIRDDSDVLNRLTAQEIYSLKQWQSFYDKTYTFMGRLAGKMFDPIGQPTDYYRSVMEQVEAAISEKQREELLRARYPPCNIEWKESTGTRVWCSQQSGGIDRAWTGYPRKYFEIGQTEYRCACVPDDRLSDTALREYENCESQQISCFYEAK